jgi:hypothetical protein
MQNNTIINLYLNEYKGFKFETLKKNCNDYLENHKRLKRFVRIHYSNKDFNEIYNEIINKTKNSPSLYIIDQNGIKFTSQENFNTLLDLKRDNVNIWGELIKKSNFIIWNYRYYHCFCLKHY